MAYGNIIKDLKIEGKPAPYPVINERSVRAGAGIMFFIGIITFLTVLYTKNFLLLNVVVGIFWLDFLLRTVFQPHFSVFHTIGDWLVGNQKKEYVGVTQKRFAWGMGLLMATIMLIGPVFLDIRGTLPIVICSICLFFMWMETAIGVCAGCKIYSVLLDKKVLKEPEHRPACPGGVCEIKKPT